jgi:signal peptidase I
MAMSTVRAVVQPIAIAIALAFAVRASSVGIYSIPSQSMQPTLQIGDTILVTPYLNGRSPSRGDVIVFHSPSVRDQMVVKRVIATPGDLIESRDGVVTIGGHALAEPYVLARGLSGAIAPQVIPADCYFVLGDNRGNSYDSRLWGVIRGDAIVGRARLVLWSTHPMLHAPQAAASPIIPADPLRERGLRLFRVVR